MIRRQFARIFQPTRFTATAIAALSFFALFAIFPGGEAKALELVLFGRTGCVWCARWERDIGEIYPRAELGRIAPLRRLDIRDQRRAGFQLGEPVLYTPTFVLIDDGVEIGRITGYQSEDMFWGTLESLVDRRAGRYYGN